MVVVSGKGRDVVMRQMIASHLVYKRLQERPDACLTRALQASQTLVNKVIRNHLPARPVSFFSKSGRRAKGAFAFDKRVMIIETNTCDTFSSYQNTYLSLTSLATKS